MTTFAKFALSQLTNNNTSAGHALDLGDSLAPNVTRSDKGRTPQRLPASSPNALTHLSKDERAELVLNSKRNYTHNFTMDPVPLKVIPRAGRAFATA